ncbi:SRPBCC family protein [Streptomyces sp. VRA16 Mangrove soil]|uniref:SRPBCC family protein n=1 Tax=Streptomyces sp. VRA16 Mangrove soil TaxID=2817434 RepID=UPI001A9F6FB2|nr:SRPBCC family protein [Streptomyces sp. VRA16 Mangrove soil]MBO1330921.1 SRPBCC family protein [Streptomyces sp. VRA16 Mangrove soil]
MAPLVSTIEIARPPGEVFACLTDPDRFRDWQPDVVAVRTQESGPLTAGRRFTTTRRVGRARRTMTQEVTAYRPGERWAARGVDGPLRPSMDVTLTPVGTGRTRVTFALDFAARGPGVVLVPLVRRRAAKNTPKSYRRFKEPLETKS